jgi:hypothetical protein
MGSFRFAPQASGPHVNIQRQLEHNSLDDDPTPDPSGDPPVYALTDIGSFTSPGATATDNHDNVVMAQFSGNGSFYYQRSSSSVVQLEAVMPRMDVVMANGINGAGKISG